MNLDSRIADAERALWLRPRDVRARLELARLYEIAGRDADAGWAYLCTEVFGHVNYQCRDRMAVIVLLVEHPDVSLLAAFLRYLKREARQHARQGASRLAGAALTIKRGLADWLESCRSYRRFSAQALVLFLAKLCAEQWYDAQKPPSGSLDPTQARTPVERILNRMEPADLLDRVRTSMGLLPLQPDLSWLDELLFDETAFPVTLYATDHAG